MRAEIKAAQDVGNQFPHGLSSTSKSQNANTRRMTARCVQVQADIKIARVAQHRPITAMSVVVRAALRVVAAKPTPTLLHQVAAVRVQRHRKWRRSGAVPAEERNQLRVALPAVERFRIRLLLVRSTKAK